MGVVGSFVRLSLGGPILGLLIGFLISNWMKRIIRDSILSVNITVIGAYLCFYIAEFTWVHVSGILSIVTLGLYFSAVGKRRIYPESEHAMHNVWGAIQFGSETLIFVLTGILVGIKMIEESTITAGDWAKMFLFWVLMLIARTIMVLTVYPVISKTGYGLTKKEFVVLIYGGLRGALGMCLSLFVGVDDSLRLRFRELTVFYMCGMAMMTIIVNGLTCGKVVDYVQMINTPEIKEKMLRRCVRRILESTQDRLREIKNEISVSYAKWRDVERDAQVASFGGFNHTKRYSKSQLASYQRESLMGDKEEALEEIRFRFNRVLNRIFWEVYEEGELSEESIQILNSSCSITDDECDHKLRYFEILEGFF